MSHTVLLADDSVTVRQAAEYVFAKEAPQLFTVGSADDLFARVAASAPNVILVDHALPGRDGFEIAAALKQDAATAHIPVVILAALNKPYDEARAASAGVAARLDKPFNADELIAAVTPLLDAPVQAAPAVAVAPAVPAQPAAAPVQPATPVAPAQPVAPVQPVAPAAPVMPAQPAMAQPAVAPAQDSGWQPATGGLSLEPPEAPGGIPTIDISIDDVLTPAADMSAPATPSWGDALSEPVLEPAQHSAEALDVVQGGADLSADMLAPMEPATPSWGDATVASAAEAAPLEPVSEPVVEAAPLEPVSEPVVDAAPLEPVMEAAPLEPVMEAAPLEPVSEPVVEAAPLEPVVEAAPLEPVSEPVVEAAPLEPVSEPVVEAAPLEPVVEAAPLEPVSEPVVEAAPLDPVSEPVEAAPLEPVVEAAPVIEEHTSVDAAVEAGMTPPQFETNTAPTLTDGAAVAEAAEAAVVEAAAVAIAEAAPAGDVPSTAAISAEARAIIEKVVWEVVPDLAETIIREEIQRLLASQ